MNDAGDDGAQNGGMAGHHRLQGALVARLDAGHELFVGFFRLRKRHLSSLNDHRRQRREAGEMLMIKFVKHGKWRWVGSFDWDELLPCHRRANARLLWRTPRNECRMRRE